MVVQTNWPGATIEDTINLVTDPIEKKLEEVPTSTTSRATPSQDSRSSTSTSRTTRRRGGPRPVVPGPQEDRRHEAHPAAGRPGAGLQRRVRRHLRHRLRLHRRRVQLPRAEGLCRNRAGRADARAGRRQDPVRRHPGREDLPGLLDPPARRTGDRPRPGHRRPPGPERGGAGRRGPGRRREGHGPGQRRIHLRGEPAGDQPARRRQVLPAGRCGAGPARLRRSAVADLPLQRPARHRHDHLDGGRRQRAGVRRGHPGADAPDRGQPAGRHQDSISSPTSPWSSRSRSPASPRR